MFKPPQTNLEQCIMYIIYFIISIHISTKYKFAPYTKTQKIYNHLISPYQTQYFLYIKCQIFLYS